MITVISKDGGYKATIKAYTTWDTTALKAAIDEAEKITPTDYEVSYANTFTSALNKANEVYANMYATQPEINDACTALTEAMTVLGEHKFIVPEINIKNGDTVLEETALIQVPEDTQTANLSLALNDGAMVKSFEITASDENGASAQINGGNVVITKTADAGSLKLNVKVIDEWDREYTKTYTLNVINTVIPVTSLELTVDGQAVSGNYTASAGGRYSNFKGVAIGYNPTPADANAITSVEYKVSNVLQFEIDSNGNLKLTNTGAASLRKSVATTVTVTVTNADGSSATASFDFTLTRA